MHDSLFGYLDHLAQAEKIVARWRADGGNDASRLLAEHPELATWIGPLLEQDTELIPDRHELDAARANAERDGWSTLAPGSVFGPYFILEHIGIGGMGCVVLARHLEQRRDVALKVILTHRLGNPDAAERFAREARAAAALEHPHICPIYDYGEVHDVPFLAMAHLRGRTLHQYFLSRGAERCTRDYVTDLLDLIEPVVRALAFAHDRGIVHRDVKPNNIMVDDSNHAVLFDFGISRNQDTRVQTMTRGPIGTPEFMAPEYLRGAPPTASLDIHALGVLLFYGLAGRLPYQGATMGALLAEIDNAPVPDVRRDNPAVSRDLSRLIAIAMAKRPKDRYGSAHALATDLARVRAGLPIEAQRPPAAVRMGFWVRRNPLVAALFLLGALFVTVSVTFGGAYARDVESDRLRAQMWDIDDLVAESEQLFPAWPENTPRLANWLARAREVEQARDRNASVPSWWADVTGRSQPRDLRARTVAKQDLLTSHVRDVEDRMAWARTAADESFTTYADRWSEAREGLRLPNTTGPGVEPTPPPAALAPQVGLVPIGQNPQSGLWEFYHLASADLSGPVPTASDYDEAGRLPMHGGSGIVFVLIPGGHYTLGSPPSVDSKDEARHRLQLDWYFLAKHELTFGQWRRLSGEAGSQNAAPNRLGPGYRVWSSQLTELHPAVDIAPAELVTTLNRHGLALPTEAQWEAACRGGNLTLYPTGDDTLSLIGHVNMVDRSAAILHAEYASQAGPFDDGFAGPAPVGSYLPNPYGLFDVIGNVQEICADYYDGNYDRPTEPRTGLRRPDSAMRAARLAHVMRGGDYTSGLSLGRSALRMTLPPNSRDHRVGVRPARALFEALK